MECCITHIIVAEEIKSLSWMLSDHILFLAERKIEIFENKYSKFSGTFVSTYCWNDYSVEASYHKFGHCISATIRIYIYKSAPDPHSHLMEN